MTTPVPLKAKIVATIGPASERPETLSSLLAAGMDAARLNFSHGSHAWHARAIRNLRRVGAARGRPLAIIADLPGPKIRSGPLAGGRPVRLRAGARLVLTGRRVAGTAERVSIDYPRLAGEVSAGDRILLSDGLIELRVSAVRAGEVVCRVVNGGDLGERKGVNLPGVKLSVSAVTSADIQHLKFALARGADYVAESFVRTAEDVRKLKRLIRAAGKDTPVLAKIEKPEAVENLESILEAADGIMVARGDLGVEMSPEKVPVAQKRIIAMANQKRIPVITATQMLESMIENPRPTRAEASDVANAVFDGTDAVMLSGETASGKYPREAVAMMAKIVSEAERHGGPRAHPGGGGEPSVPETVADAVAAAADHLDLEAVVVFTESGYSARLVSKARPGPPIVAFAHREQVRQRLSLLWGVVPRKIRRIRSVDRLIREALRDLVRDRVVRHGDTIAFVAGTPLDTPGTTNLIQFLTIGPA